MNESHRKYIAVIGRGSCTDSEANLAEQVGQELARAGAVLVCGGLGGMMEAACRGAKNAGGTTIGILPGHDRACANKFVDYAVCTGLGEARNIAVVMSADGIIALPGEFGTLSEISFALKYQKPIVSLQSWVVSERIIVVQTPSEAVERILQEVNR
jgi:hypothetical protein